MKQAKTIKVELLIERYTDTRIAYQNWLKKEGEAGKMYSAVDRLLVKMDLLEQILKDAGYEKDDLEACYVQATTKKTEASIS